MSMEFQAGEAIGKLARNVTIPFVDYSENVYSRILLTRKIPGELREFETYGDLKSRRRLRVMHLDNVGEVGFRLISQDLPSVKPP